VTADSVPVPVNAPSCTVTPDRVTFPVFVTANEYVTGVPAAGTADGEALFTTDRPGAGAADTVALDGDDVTAGPDGGVPDAVAVFVTEPASTSACVTEYVVVHVSCAPGARFPAGHVTGDNVPVPVKAPSFTVTRCRVTFPVLITANEYVTDWPAADTAAGDADFTTDRPGAGAAETVALDGSDVTAGPEGGVPDAVAEFVTEPASTSACVTV
jgi:hypothetical protein